MKTFLVEVSRAVEVEIDPKKFTREKMTAFKEVFYPFDTLEEHAEHIAKHIAMGGSLEDVEGYNPESMGIKILDRGRMEAVAEEQ